MPSARPPAASHPPGCARCRECCRTSRRACARGASAAASYRRDFVPAATAIGRPRGDVRPTCGARREIAQIDSEHIVNMETAPDVDEIFEFPRKRLLMRGEIRRVDSTRRHAGQHIRAKIRKRARQLPENADLVGGARTAAGEHERQIGTRVWNAYSLRWKDLLGSSCCLRARHSPI